MTLTHYDVTFLFLALAVLLGVARLFGELARALHQPPILGEILAGVLLGPTVLGRFWPELQGQLFPAEGAVAVALQGFLAVAIALFLLVAGLEVDLSVAFRQGRATLLISTLGMLVPFALGFVVAVYIPALVIDTDFIAGNEVVFALFFATALCISALPVIAKILKDLNLLKSDLGVIVVSAATVNDLIGWIIFAMVLGLMGASNSEFGLGMIIGMTLLFVGVMLTVGRWAIHRMLPWLQANTGWPAGVLGFAIIGALACGALTEWIGIHAIFGAFIFGVALGDTRHLRVRTRETLDQFISFIFAPLFFASIGLHVDFIGSFDLVAVVVVLILATVGKLAGCLLGGRLAGLAWGESWAIGFAKNARGAMEIILGLLALQFGLINDQLFVALVIMALVTSMASGSMMQIVLGTRKPLHFSDYITAATFVGTLTGKDRHAVIGELSDRLSSATKLDRTAVADAVWEREQLMPTGLPNGVAIPHARLKGLARPVMALGLSDQGIDFDSPDGEKARMIFLILTPADDPAAQLDILSGIARLARSPSAVREILQYHSYTEVIANLKVPPES